MNTSLIEVCTARPEDLPFKKSTLYKFHSLKKYPQLIFKVAGRLYFDADEWLRMARESQRLTIQAAERLRASGEKR